MKPGSYKCQNPNMSFTKSTLNLVSMIQPSVSQTYPLSYVEIHQL